MYSLIYSVYFIIGRAIIDLGIRYLSTKILLYYPIKAIRRRVVSNS